MASEYRPKIEDLSEYQKLIGEVDASLGEEKDVEVFEDAGFDADKVQKKDVLDFGEECFLLKYLLTEEESRSYIDQGEKLGFGDISEAKQSYRNCQRYAYS